MQCVYCGLVGESHVDSAACIQALVAKLKQLQTYVIMNMDNVHEFWSSEHGWTQINLAEGFSVEEKENFDLPDAGIWVLTQHLKTLELARLVSASDHFGCFEDAQRLRKVADEMNLDIETVWTIINHTHTLWENCCHKEKVHYFPIKILINGEEKLIATAKQLPINVDFRVLEVQVGAKK
jgi:hypothetical protein